MKWTRLIALVLTTTVGGCAGIDITHVAPDSTALTGAPWNLSMTQFKITITRQITGCTGKLEGSVAVTATPAKVLDDQQECT